MFAWKRDSADISQDEPLFRVRYLGSIQTQTATGNASTTVPLLRLWTGRDVKTCRKVTVQISTRGIYMYDVDKWGAKSSRDDRDATKDAVSSSAHDSSPSAHGTSSHYTYQFGKEDNSIYYPKSVNGTASPGPVDNSTNTSFNSSKGVDEKFIKRTPHNSESSNPITSEKDTAIRARSSGGEGESMSSKNSFIHSSSSQGSKKVHGKTTKLSTAEESPPTFSRSSRYFDIEDIGYCVADRTVDNRLFCWTCRNPDSDQMELHAVLCSGKDKAVTMAAVLSRAFSQAYKIWTTDAVRKEGGRGEGRDVGERHKGEGGRGDGGERQGGGGGRGRSQVMDRRGVNTCRVLSFRRRGSDATKLNELK